MSRKYTSIFATFRHREIRSVSEMKNKRWHTMGLFCNGKEVGEGELKKIGPAIVQTDGTRVKPRGMGHGIELYKHLIETARRIGAKRVYSSSSLSRHSRRMWSMKLPKIYKVEIIKSTKPCRRCGRRGDSSRYFIRLQEKKNG